MNRRSILAGVIAAPLLARAARAQTGARDLAPLVRASHWVDERVGAARLRGRAVLVDVFTFECINCTRITPNLMSLYRSYARADLEIVAVHTPEVPSYQGRTSYVARQATAAALPWPIAIDNDYRIWHAYDVSAWPTQLLFDRGGRLRETFVGDGANARVNAAIAELVRGR